MQWFVEHYIQNVSLCDSIRVIKGGFLSSSLALVLCSSLIREVTDQVLYDVLKVFFSSPNLKASLSTGQRRIITPLYILEDLGMTSKISGVYIYAGRWVG